MLRGNIATSSLKVQCKHLYTVKCYFVCFVALRPKSTAMFMARRSVHLTTIFPGQA